jgi:transketolase
MKISPVDDEQLNKIYYKKNMQIRKLILRMVKVDGRGHIGSAMSLVELLSVLYGDFLKYKSSNSDWNERDRLILSKGHGCLALYAILAHHGFFPYELLDTYGRLDSPLGGHPEKGRVPGIEASTGSLGHGMSIGVGMAIACKIKKNTNWIVVIVGDGELNEGSIWEAALAANKHKLDNLLIIVDSNKMQANGFSSDVLEMNLLAEKFKSFGFSVFEVDGHNVISIKDSLSKLPINGGMPIIIICHTIKGKGINFAEHNPDWHHKSGLDEVSINELVAGLDSGEGI